MESTNYFTPPENSNELWSPEDIESLMNAVEYIDSNSLKIEQSISPMIHEETMQNIEVETMQQLELELLSLLESEEEYRNRDLNNQFTPQHLTGELGELWPHEDIQNLKNAIAEISWDIAQLIAYRIPGKTVHQIESKIRKLHFNEEFIEPGETIMHQMELAEIQNLHYNMEFVEPEETMMQYQLETETQKLQYGLETTEPDDFDRILECLDFEIEDNKVETEKKKKKWRKFNRWTNEEHGQFLRGLEELGVGDWKNISLKYVPSRTPQQVASHAQKFLLRHQVKEKHRSSINDNNTIDDKVISIPLDPPACGEGEAMASLPPQLPMPPAK